MKENTMVRIDYDLKRKAIKNNINLSSTLEESLRIKLGLIEGSTTEIDLEILNMDLEKEQENAEKIAQKVNFLLEKREKILENLQKKQSEDLKKQKESLEKMVRCLNCGTLTGETTKRHKLKNGILCNTCFHTIDPMKLKELM